MRAVRRGSVCLDLSTAVGRRSRPRPRLAASRRVARGRRRRRRCVEQGVLRGRARPALPRPLPPARAPGLRRPGGAGRASPPRTSTSTPSTRPLAGSAAGTAQRRAARRRRARGAPVDDRADRRSRHRQDHDRRADARPAGRPGRTTAASRLSIALTAPDRQGRLAAAGGGASASSADLPPEDRDRVGRLEAMTLHRLLGWRPDNATRFRHDRGNRLKYDVVVVDESSMVELTMMARLLEAVRPQSRLVLVGDPRQLTSVGAGAVLSDLVAGYDGDPASPVVSLTENFRSTEDIKTLAEALRRGDADAVVDVAARRLRRGRVRRDRRRPRPCCAPTPWPPRSPSAGPRPSRRRRGRRPGARRAPPAVRAPGRARTASATGTGRSSGGSARRPGQDIQLPSGTSAGRCW